MFRSRRMSVVLAGVSIGSALLACALVGAASAQATGPATVTVRVVGSEDQSVLPITQLTTNETPVVKDNKEGKPEGSCSGTSAAGALQLATEVTKGSWDGPWELGEYSVETIDGISYPFSQPPFYWNFWLNNKESSAGICAAELSTGDNILLFVGCYSTKNECPATPPNVLAIEAPASAEVGKPVTVSVLSYPSEGGEPKPAVGVNVEGWGSSTETNAEGHATLVFPGDDTYTLRALGASGEASKAVPGEALVCVHNGNDGMCGTQAPPSSTTSVTSTSSTTKGGSTLTGALTAKVAGVKNGRVYSRHAAPRLLKGTVTVPAGVLLQKVQISLKRRYRGRCYAFDGSSVRFVAIKCKQDAPFFSVGTNPSFSYLLPARLPRGSYTYDIEAVNGAGQSTKLVNGVSKLAFRVK
jgi:hypothetical protein